MAHFFSGGQQAILTGSGGENGPSVSYRKVGTEIDFLPIVMENGHIYLDMTPRVRSVNEAMGIQTTSGFVPGFNERSAPADTAPAEAAAEQSSAMTPTGQPSRSAGQGGAPDVLVCTTMVSLLVLSIVLPP